VHDSIGNADGQRAYMTGMADAQAGYVHPGSDQRTGVRVSLKD